MLRMEDKKRPDARPVLALAKTREFGSHTLMQHGTRCLDSSDDPDFHDGYTPIRPRAASTPCAQPRPRSTIVVTASDEARLRALLKEQAHAHHAAIVRCLDVALSHAFVVAPHLVAPDIVTMNSQVLYQDHHSPRLSSVRLVYSTTTRNDHQVPVLSALGIALLGAQVGQTTMWSSLDRQVRRLRVTGLPYQPERAGDFHL